MASDVIQFPLFEPDRSWSPPNHFPDLSDANIISFDTETKDPYLLEKGPGTFRNDGYIVGISIATDTGFCGYYPIRHGSGGNIDRGIVLEWLNDQLGGSQLKVGANILYDLERLRAEGVTVRGPLHDVIGVEPLIDENRDTYNLDSLCKRYLGTGKTEDGLLAAGQAYGYKSLREVKGNLWKLHAADVGPYAEADAADPLNIYFKQMQAIRDEDLMQVYQLEMNLIPVLLDMRFLGVAVDLDQAERVEKMMKDKAAEYAKRIRNLCGRDIDVWSNVDLARAFDKLHIKYNTTALGNPSFTADWLDSHPSDLAKFIKNQRKYARAASAGIRKMILENASNGRIHPTFKPTRDEEGGTRSGRFACANPNLQQVSARDPEIGPAVRGIFIPDGGFWCAADYSQQEPRVTVHYGELMNFNGAKEAGDNYRKDPSTDYHQMIATMAGIPRKQAKTINLGLAYGMGLSKLSRELGMDFESAKEVKSQYDERVPFIPKLYEACMARASSQGYIKTLLGRKCRFNLYEPCGQYGNDENYVAPRPYEEALKLGVAIQRAGTYKAMNRLIQGSSADMIKQAMIDVHRAGYTPHLSIHDELDFTLHSEKEVKEVQEIMLNCVKLTVPLKLDMELGENWGSAA